MKKLIAIVASTVALTAFAATQAQDSQPQSVKVVQTAPDNKEASGVVPVYKVEAFGVDVDARDYPMEYSYDGYMPYAGE